MRRFIAYLAVSADGFIARPDGSVDWLDRPRPSDYGYAAFIKSVDTIVMGRRTYEFALQHGGAASFGKKQKLYVVSTTLQEVAPGMELVRGDVPSFAARLRAAKGKNIWLLGGAPLWGAFLDAGALDELMLFVVPVLIGEGIPLLDPRRRTAELSLLGTETYEDGIVKLHYAIRRT